MPRTDLLRPRDRLNALGQPSMPQPDPVVVAESSGDVPSARLGDPEPPAVLPLRRPGRLARRWVPDSLRHARWEPGRTGALALCAVAAVAALVAAAGVWRDRPVAEPVPPMPALVTESPEDPAVPGAGAVELVVDVAGRVARPGLVRLPDGARVADALTAAGGALPDTDLTGLNLARKIGDGEQLLVGVPPPPGAAAPAGPAGAPVPSGGRVDLNTATLADLDTLPGVGPVTAQRILDWRQTNGRFRSVDQLREIEGIGESRFARLRDLVRV